MIPKKEAYTTGTRTQEQTLKEYPPEAKYSPKPVTPKQVKTVDSDNPLTKIPMRPIN